MTLESIFAASGAALLLLVIIEIAFWVLIGSSAIKWLKSQARGGERCKCNGRTYPLTATDYTLCIECGTQYPASEEEE